MNRIRKYRKPYNGYKKNGGYKKQYYRKTPLYRSPYKKKTTTYDGVYFAKCITNVDIGYDLYVDGARFLISWASAATAPVTTGGVTTFTSPLGSAEFQSLRARFMEYCVVGMKVTVSLYQQVTSVVSSSLGMIQSGSDASRDVRAVPLSEANLKAMILGAKDYKQYKPDQIVKRYYHVASWLKGQGKEYIPASDNFPEAQTAFIFNQTGYSGANQVVMGQATVTWYVKFKGWRQV